MITLEQFALVVVAELHNPTVLNPDFLKYQEILPGDWELSSPPITTLSFSTIQYTNGINIIAEPNKVQFIDTKGGDPPKSHIVEIMERYIAALPHVRYKALGINFKAYEERTDPYSFIISRFLKSGPWYNNEHELSGLALKFVYPIEKGRAIISLDSGSVNKIIEDKKIEEPVLTSDGNFHRDLDINSKQLSEQIISLLGNVESDWEKYTNILMSLLNEEG